MLRIVARSHAEHILGGVKLHQSNRGMHGDVHRVVQNGVEVAGDHCAHRIPLTSRYGTKRRPRTPVQPPHHAKGAVPECRTSSYEHPTTNHDPVDADRDVASDHNNGMATVTERSHRLLPPAD